MGRESLVESVSPHEATASIQTRGKFIKNERGGYYNYINVDVLYLESCSDSSHPLQAQFGVFNVCHQTSTRGEE